MEENRKMMNVKRFTTGLIGFPIVAVILVFGPIYLIDVLFSIIAIMALHEYFDSFKEKAKPVVWLGYIACIMIAFIHVIPKEFLIHVIAVLVPLFILALFLQVLLTNMKTNVKDIAITFFGICYIPLFLMFVPILMGIENGKILVWYILFTAWGTDVFAYLVGKLLGKHKFSQISPNKTIEGCIGGIVGALILSILYTIVINHVWQMNLSYLWIGLMAILLSIIGQIGDFAASSIKRYVGIKDFSNLIPGHGGMLDRIDSIIFIAPFAYFFIRLII